MDEQKNTPERNSGQATPGDRRSRRAEPIGSVPKEHLAAPNGRRRRDEETDAKMRLLWALLGVLVVILVVAIIYEIVLGYGTRETGSQRMNESAGETELLSGQDADDSETEEAVVIVQDAGSDAESETGEDAGTGSESESAQDSGADQTSKSGDDNSGEADDTQDSGTAQETDAQMGVSASQDVTLAGLGN